MEEKNMRELNMDEMDKVSGGSNDETSAPTEAGATPGSNYPKVKFKNTTLTYIYANPNANKQPEKARKK